MNYSKRVIKVRGADRSKNKSIFIGKLCFGYVQQNFSTENGETPKFGCWFSSGKRSHSESKSWEIVVDFVQKQQTLEIVEDFACEANNLGNHRIFRIFHVSCSYHFFHVFQFFFFCSFYSFFMFPFFHFVYFPYLHFLFCCCFYFFVLLFFLCSSRRQNRKNRRQVLIVKMTTFSCENKIFGPRWTGLGTSPFEGDHRFHFSFNFPKIFLVFLFILFSFLRFLSSSSFKYTSIGGSCIRI